jgi:hypothetical protein
MNPEKVLIRALLLAVAGCAFEVGAFFTPTESVREPMVEEARPKVAKAFTCAMHIRYDAPRPQALEITYIGGVSCLQLYVTAAEAAVVVGPKVTVGGEPAIPVLLQCSIMVAFNPATAASAVDLGYTGIGCEASRPAALRAARQLARCMSYPSVPCQE